MEVILTKTRDARRGDLSIEKHLTNHFHSKVFIVFSGLS
jgi:hypothetical protein